MGLMTAALGPTLPGLAEQTASSLRGVSYLFSARSLGYLAGSFSAGRAYDRFGGHPILASAVICMAALALTVPLIPFLWLLTIVMVGLGFGEGFLDVGGNTMLVWQHGSKVGPFMNGLHFCFGLGAFIAPIVIAQAIDFTGDIRWAYWVLGGVAWLPAVWIVRFPSPTIHKSADTSVPGQVNTRLLALIVIFFFLYVGAEAGYAGWIYTYALSLKLANETSAAYLASMFWGSFTLGRFLAIPLSVKIAPRTLLVADMIGTGIGMSAILIWNASQTVLWGGTFLVGISLASLFPTTVNLAEERMVINGRVASWFFIGASAGGMCVPWLIGQVFEQAGPGITMVMIAVDLALTAAVFVLMLRQMSRSALKSVAGR
jgi:FHS family Na+ dependent glucose MFS transporter 1